MKLYFYFLDIENQTQEIKRSGGFENFTNRRFKGKKAYLHCR